MLNYQTRVCLLLPVLDFTSNLNLHLIRIVRDDEIYKVLCSWFKLELALIKIAHTFHHYFDKRHSIIDALWNDNGRIAGFIVLMGYNGMSSSLYISSSHTCL